MDKTIFTVQIEKISAELEVGDGIIKCISGNTIHFEISRKELRSYLHLKRNKFLLNFTQRGSLYQITISSKHILSILSILKKLTKSK